MPPCSASLPVLGDFHQWKQLGCSVNRRPDHVEAGQWGCPLAVYIPITKKAEEPADDEDEDEEKTFWILKRFTVFNADQVNGRPMRNSSRPWNCLATVHPDYEPAEELILKSGAEIHFGGDKAFYRPPTPVGTWPNHHDGRFHPSPAQIVIRQRQLLPHHPPRIGPLERNAGWLGS